MRLPSSSALLAAALLASVAQAQSTGGPAGTTPRTPDLSTPMQEQPSGTNPGSAAGRMSDRDFAMTAAIANKVEIMQGQLALARASDPELKEFAQLMVKDHTTALGELQAAARAANIALPADIALDQAHQAEINAIKNRKGANFDQSYRTDQVQAHHKAVALLDTYAQTGGNAALRAWAAQTLPVVRKHLQHLQSLGMASGSP